MKGFPSANYKRFDERHEAETFISQSKEKLATGSISASANGSEERYDVEFSDSARKDNGRAESVSDMTEKLSSMKLAAESEEGYDVVYSEGVCKGNGQIRSIAGIGAWWGHRDSRYALSLSHKMCLMVHAVGI